MIPALRAGQRIIHAYYTCNCYALGTRVLYNCYALGTAVPHQYLVYPYVCIIPIPGKSACGMIRGCLVYELAERSRTLFTAGNPVVVGYRSLYGSTAVPQLAAVRNTNFISRRDEFIRVTRNEDQQGG